MTLQMSLFLMSMFGLSANGYFFRRKNLTGIVCGLLMTIPSTINGIWNHSLSYMLGGTLMEFGIATIICLLIWGFGYCVAWITEEFFYDICKDR